MGHLKKTNYYKKGTKLKLINQFFKVLLWLGSNFYLTGSEVVSKQKTHCQIVPFMKAIDIFYFFFTAILNKY